MIASDTGLYIEKGECLRLCAEWEGNAASVASLFAGTDKVNFETFAAWLDKNYEVGVLISWFL